MKTAGSWVLLLVLPWIAAASGAEDGLGSSPAELVTRAFDRTLRAPGVRSVELRVHRGGRLVSRRAFDVAYRRDPVSARSLLRFTAPSYLRGQALLVVETPDGASDTWLYQTEERRPRRVGSAHKSDSFYGSDLSFEELEHQRWDRFGMRRLPDDREGGASCTVVEATPGSDSQYARLAIWIDRARQAVARIDFFRNADGGPVKRLRVDLDGVEEDAGFLRIRHMRMEQVGRDAWTDVETLRMAIDPEISPDVFSAAFLEREGDDLYALVGRHGQPGNAP